MQTHQLNQTMEAITEKKAGQDQMTEEVKRTPEEMKKELKDNISIGQVQMKTGHAQLAEQIQLTQKQMKAIKNQMVPLSYTETV